MNRRRFIAAVATATAAYPAEPVAVEFVHPRSPYESLVRHIEPGHDEFPLEAEAARVAAHLKQILTTRALPLAPDFTGLSPLPARFRKIADGVEVAEFGAAPFATGLQEWIASLGIVRTARFFVLPDDRVRFEVASSTGYRVGLWKQRWVEGRLSEFAPLEETLTTSPAPLFCDITGHAFGAAPSFRDQLLRGIPYWRSHLDAATGIDVHGHNGIAVGDIDGDGVDEVYVCQPAGLPNRLYKIRADGVFEDITETAGVGVLDGTASALFVDFRNSGMQDLVVLRPDGPLLFLNQGGNRFAHKPGAFRFRTPPQGSFTSMAAADFDRDGFVDLYFCSYSFFRDGGQYRFPTPYEDARNGPPNYLFRNDFRSGGTGVFTDVTEAVGLNQNNDRFSLAAAWCDYNGDGWPDLFVSNDFGRKNLYRNEGGKFRDVAAEAGVEDPGAGMSAAWFDYDGDGRPDLYVSNMWSDAGQRIVARNPSELWRRHPKGNSLYRNRGDGTFEETGAIEGVEMGRWAWSSGGFDFDNDGTPEIFIAAGMLTNSSEKDLESFFWRKVAAASGKEAYENGWNALSQAAHEQYSEAGRQPNVFYVRRGGRYYDFSGISGLDLADDSRAFAVTDFDGDGSPDLILKSRLGPQVRVFRNDSVGDRRSIAFRLRGTNSNRDAIGARVEVDGQVKFLEAGSGYLSQHSKVLLFGVGRAEFVRTARVRWPSGVEQEFHHLAAGALHRINEGSAEVTSQPFRPRTKINASPVAGDNSSELADTWLIDPVALPEKHPPGFLHLSADIPPERAQLYAVFVRYLFDLRSDLKLPVWFLVDDRSRARKICFSPPDPAELTRAPAPLPFPGKYYAAPERDYSSLGAGYFAAGYPELALGYLERAPQNAKILVAIGKIHLGAGRLKPARSYLEQGLAREPDSADGWNSLGAVAVGEENIALALRHFEKALSLLPKMPSALVNAGQAKAALGDPAAAEALFRRALDVDPRDAAAANQMGELLARQRQDTEARHWFQQAIASRRDYAPAIGNLGELYRRNGQPNDAVAAFRYGIEVAPDDDAFYLNLAGVYVSQENRPAARAVVESLLRRKPGSARARQALRELDTP